MKHIFLIMFLFISFIQLNAQKDSVTTNEEILMPEGEGRDEEIIGGNPNGDEIFTVVEQQPQFPGGDKAMDAFFASNLIYPALAKEQGIQGKVWMSFTVGKDGKVSDIEVLRAIGGGCDEEAVRVLRLMPNWIPGKQSGRPVTVKFRMPVMFTIK